MVDALRLLGGKHVTWLTVVVFRHTVFAGAITTLGAGIFMLLCQVGGGGWWSRYVRSHLAVCSHCAMPLPRVTHTQLTFFTKMAALITSTIVFAVLYSLFFFMSLLALVGPTGTCGDLHHLYV